MDYKKHDYYCEPSSLKKLKKNHRTGVNCSDKALQYKDMDEELREGFLIAWMKIIIKDKHNWKHRKELEEWINHEFGLNLFEEFKKII